MKSFRESGTGAFKAGKRSLIAAGVFAVCHAVTATPVSAQTAVADDVQLGPLRVEDSVLTGPTSGYKARGVRSATKTDTPLRDVPQSVTILTRDLIDDLDMQNMADIVRYVPGVSMGQGEGHRDAPTLRGNSSTADFFVDGVRDDVQYYRDLYNVERVEVLKGPNAMIFGRGGGGGVINRIMKRAGDETGVSAAFETGSYDHYRLEGDAGAAVSGTAAVRLNAMYENSESYRRFYELERYGINPTATLDLSDATQVRLSYEYFDDFRRVDRGVPSQAGRPYATGRSTFFGNPDLSYATTAVHLASATVEHAFNNDIHLRNHTVFAAYDKFYQNVFARNAVNAAGNLNLEAYQSGTDRENIFNQTDVTWSFATGAVAHTLLGGVEVGTQETDNLRNNSTFNPLVAAGDPVSFAPVVFGVPNQNNKVKVNVVAAYVQDQIALTSNLQLIAGLRYDSFDMKFDNRLNGSSFARKDNLWSPRAGLVFKPVEPVSLYASYSISYLPSSGDQFASLDATAQALKPEKFENIEIGAKWDITPRLSASIALYQLDRANTRAPGPTAGTIVLTGEQRSKGIEIEFSGNVTDAWQIIGGYTYQDAKIKRTTSAAPAGRHIPLVPDHSFSLWNRYQFTPMWGAGIGVIHHGEVFTSISNAVTLPSFTRVDAGVFFMLNERIEAQLNVENIFDTKYYATAHNDNNITPGAPTIFRVGVKARF